MEVNKLNEKLRSIQKEIDEIQDSCVHKDKKIEMIEGGESKWTCIFCKKRISYPTPQELDKFLGK